MQFSPTDISALEKAYRTNLINSLSGFKGVFVIGTQHKSGKSNLAIFNSMMHIGANPPLMGFIQRPASVSRHTYENIIENQVYTVNAVQQTWIEKGHQTAARYDEQTSEFEAVGLTELYIDDFKAPFVKESVLQIGLKFREQVDIKSNDTILIIGEIVHISIPETAISEDGFIDHELLETASSVGLDAYYSSKKITRFSYSKPDKSLIKF